MLMLARTRSLLSLSYNQEGSQLHTSTAAPRWIPDSSVECCPICENPFNIFIRRHHCRNCGGVFCGECSNHSIRLSYLGYERPERVCDSCYEHLGFANSSDEGVEEDLLIWRGIVANIALIPTKELIRRVRKNVPPSVRGSLWSALAGADKLLKKNEGVYSILRKKGTDRAFEEMITVDVMRTFPDHPEFESLDDGEVDAKGNPRFHARQESLRNILRAYAYFDKNLGYCQGLSFLAAVPLLVMDEEHAFWLIIQLMKQHHISHLLMRTLPQLEVFLKHFNNVFRAAMPNLYKFMAKKGIEVEMYGARWLCTLFTYDLPMPLVLRLWDVFWVLGVDAIYKMALLILQMSEERLLNMETTQCLQYLTHLPENMFQCPDQLIASALDTFSSITPFPIELMTVAPQQ